MNPDQLDQEVLFILNQHVGKCNRIDRWLLVEKIYGSPVPMQLRNDANVQDREIRLSVGRLREHEHMICDLGDGKGRYIAANEEEFWEFYNFYEAPVRSREGTLRAMRKAAARHWPNVLQMNLFSMDAGVLE